MILTPLLVNSVALTVLYSSIIQSLQSKHEKLKNFILTLANKNVQIDLIALQETWTIKHPQLLDIPGFQPLIFTNRKKGRGGGAGFYIRTGINYTINNELSKEPADYIPTLPNSPPPLRL